jgi:hypothetical protein
MSKHTPAPWVITNGRCIYGNGDFIKPFVASVEDDHNDAETAANARLISSAPDLLAALQDIVDAYQRHFDAMPVAWQTYDNIARAAIAKAAGDAT